MKVKNSLDYRLIGLNEMCVVAGEEVVVCHQER